MSNSCRGLAVVCLLVGACSPIVLASAAAAGPGRAELPPAVPVAAAPVGVAPTVGELSVRVDTSVSVTSASASRETGLVTLVGTGPVGAVLRFADADADVDVGAGGAASGPDGGPVAVPVGDDTRWSAEFLFPDAVREWAVRVTAHDGYDGPVEASAVVIVTVPTALTGTAELLDDGSVRLSGTGEDGGEVSLETTDGHPVADAHGRPATTSIGPWWELVLPRSVLPESVVVARQRVHGLPQGKLHVVLPGLPGRPAPEPGRPEPEPGRPVPESGSSSLDVSDGGPAAPPPPITGQPASRAPARLALTGTDPSRPLTAAGVLLASGLGGLLVPRIRSRRGAHIRRGTRSR